MELPTQVIKSKTVNPSLLTVFGQSKVGKTTMLSKLNNCLIIDTEKGTRYVDALKVHVNNSTELKEVVKALKGDEGTVYDYLALDTIDNVVSWFEKDVARDNNVDSFAKIPFGDGYNQVRTRVMNMITALMDCCDHVIIIGHRKKTIIGNESVEVNVSSLDLSGKLKNYVMAKSDAIGFVYRDEEGHLKISFEASDEIEAGTRLPHLAGKILDFKWSEIYKTAVGK
jgi:molybdopterin-guanine dinucleotide biosynthesis protein